MANEEEKRRNREYEHQCKLRHKLEQAQVKAEIEQRRHTQKHPGGHILDSGHLIMMTQGSAIYARRQSENRAVVVGDDVVWHKNTDPQCLGMNGEEAIVEELMAQQQDALLGWSSAIPSFVEAARTVSTITGESRRDG